MRARFSELALLGVLVLLLALVRIYYGGDRGLMVVWKGEPTFKDTLVDLPQMMSMPADAIKREHPSVHWQLVAMDILDENVELQSVIDRRRRLDSGPTEDNEGKPQAAPESQSK